MTLNTFRPVGPRNFESLGRGLIEVSAGEEECATCRKRPDKPIPCLECRNIQYCSQECYKTNEQPHQDICQPYMKLKDAQLEKSPIVMFFPHEESTPRLLRLGIVPYIGETVMWTGFELCDLSRFILEHQMVQRRVVKKDLTHGQDLSSEYVIWSRVPIHKSQPSGDVGSKKGFRGPENQAIHGFVGTYGSVHGDWKGPILIAKRPKQSQIDDCFDDISTEWEDMTPKDAQVLKNLFVEFGNEDVDRAFSNRRKTTKGVKITCKGDQRAFGLEPFESVDVPLDHPVFQQEPTHISERVGFPVLVRRYEKDRVWKKGGESLYGLLEASLN